MGAPVWAEGWKVACVLQSLFWYRTAAGVGHWMVGKVGPDVEEVCTELLDNSVQRSTIEGGYIDVPRLTFDSRYVIRPHF